MTTVVADSGDINSIKSSSRTDSTTNPSLIAAAAEMPAYAAHRRRRPQAGPREAGDNASDKDVAALAFKTLAVAFGKKILEIVPGRVSTEVDARLSYDTEATIEQARDIIAQYDKPASPRDASSSRSPPPGRASRPPRSSRRRASTAT
jgi:transaldolase